jgi:hypothetical protein
LTDVAQYVIGLMDIFGLYSNHTYDHYIFSRPDEPENLKNMLVNIAKPYVETFGLFRDALNIQAIEQFVLFSDPERAQAIERKYPHINKKYIESFNELKNKIYSESAELGIPIHELGMN